MKTKIIYCFKVIRNIFDTTIILMLITSFIRTLFHFKYYFPDGGYIMLDWKRWFLNNIVYFRRIYPEIEMIDKYIWQYCLEIFLFSLPTVFFIGLEFYKKRIFIFKKVDEYKAKRLENKKTRLADKLNKLSNYNKNLRN